MTINWNNIGSIDGQREAFEELVCQLARKEEIPTQKEFTRIGKPDGGKECFWKLEDGTIHCWQAKYFIRSLGSSEWAQIDKSVKNAIDNHPNLSHYYVVMPIDRPDPKKLGKSMLQKWEEQVDKWVEYSSKKGLNVEFYYWGKHELETRLINPENTGLLFYFFNQQELSDDWFEKKNQENIDALGARYTPSLNFEIPFSKVFDGFTRDSNFATQINNYFTVLMDKYHWLMSDLKVKAADKEKERLSTLVDTLRSEFRSLVVPGIQPIPFLELDSLLISIQKCRDSIESIVWNIIENWEQEQVKKGKPVNHYSRPHNNQLHYLREFQTAINAFSDFLSSPTCKIANDPFLILIGPAGIGKSHCLADIVSRRKEQGYLSLLLLGENFSTSEMPWTQILNNQLRFGQNEDVFLGALNAKAESQQQRIIIIIDALNEGNGRIVWPNRLKAFIRSLKDFPWLGLMVSIRNSFERLIAPNEDLSSNFISRVRHPGFEGIEYEASNHFFKNYDITPPGTPLLHPEFQNPLFLKLFCQGLYKRRLTEIPSGYKGISSIIDFFIESVEFRLSKPDQLDYDIKLQLVKISINKLLQMIVDSEKDHLTYEAADKIVSSIFLGKCGSSDNQFLKRLISEGVLNEDLYWSSEKEEYFGIHFAYQRFQDHLIVSALLDKYLDMNDPIGSFESGPLQELVMTKGYSHYDQNLLEALSIQVPERTGMELHEVAPYAAKDYSVAIAFIDGLIWRRPDTIGNSSRNYVNNVLAKDQDLFFNFLEVVVSLTTRSEFYFNGDKLHNFLYGHSLANRDSWWTIWLQNKYGNQVGSNSVKRLIDWAWHLKDKEHLDNESIRLASITLSWFLTSANRYLRDSATKALVNLLENRLQILLQVLNQFIGVNDPYVLERLFGVAYGCSLRTFDKTRLVELSEFTYINIFDKPEVFPDILLRDYARGIIEFTHSIGLTPKIELQKVRPPYKSQPIPDEFPTNEEIDARYNPKQEGDHMRKTWGTIAILQSMTTEYGRGVMGYGDFGRYVFQRRFESFHVDSNGLSNYAVQKIFELGYDPKIFSAFDSDQGKSGHTERMGKKYQWIVFHELLARVADNDPEYEGPWSPFIRDIDPTILIKNAQEQRYKGYSENWWFDTKYSSWNKPDKEWVKDQNDLPDVKSIIEKTDLNNDHWIWLNLYPNWYEPVPIGEEKWHSEQKRITYQLDAYIIHNNDLNNFKKAFEKSFKFGEFPREKSNYEIFSREYYWSPTYESFHPDKKNEWIEVHKEWHRDELIGSVLQTAEYYNWEAEFDCSKESIGHYKPSRILYEEINMRPSKNEGEFDNNEGQLVCLDPCVQNPSISGLLIKKSAITEFLNHNKFSLIWEVYGEKQILHNNWRPEDYPGRMIIRGLFFMDGEELQGNIQTKMEGT